jgi:bifunctional DNA-binding transcriptional regulator/antitoxin component of YhaV-PrlF toxin-antitoxin module
MSNINELKNQLISDAIGQKRRLPFKKLVVNHANQEFVLRDGENEKLLGKQVEIFVVGEFAQYHYFDPKLERITMLSQIVRPYYIRKAIDLKSGRPVAELIEKLKSQGTKPTYTTILLVMVKVDDEWQEAVFYLKGALLQSWLGITKELQGYGATPIASLLKLSLKAQKKGAVKYSTLALSEYTECNDVKVFSKAVILLNKFKEELKRYNAFEPPTEELPVEPEETTDDIPEY